MKGLKDVEEGRDPPHIMRDAVANRFPPTFARSVMVDKATDWRAYLRSTIEEEERAGVTMAGAFAGGQLEQAFGSMLREREQSGAAR